MHVCMYVYYHYCMLRLMGPQCSAGVTFYSHEYYYIRMHTYI